MSQSLNPIPSLFSLAVLFFLSFIERTILFLVIFYSQGAMVTFTQNIHDIFVHDRCMQSEIEFQKTFTHFSSVPFFN